MATFKNTSDHQIDIPALDVHLKPGETVEIPDEAATGLANNPDLSSSQVKNATVTVDAAQAESFAPFEQAIPASTPAAAPPAGPADPGAPAN